MKRVSLYDSKGTLIDIFKAQVEVAEYIDIPIPNVCRAIKEGHLRLKGLYYVRLTLEESRPIIELPINSRAVSTYNYNGQLVEVFADDESLSNKLNITLKKVKDCITKGTPLEVDDGGVFFVSGGSLKKIDLKKDQSARPLRLYHVLKKGRLELSSYSASDIAKKLGLSKTLIHSSAQHHRAISGGKRKVYYSEIEGLKVAHAVK